MNYGKKRMKLWEQPERIGMIKMFARSTTALSQIADKMGIHVQTLRKWILESPTIKEAVMVGAHTERVWVENQMQAQIKAGNVQMFNLYFKIFYPHLLNPHKYRGLRKPTMNASIMNEIADLEEKSAAEAEQRSKNKKDNK